MDVCCRVTISCRSLKFEFRYLIATNWKRTNSKSPPILVR
uniref:Uncharacterized protein n=1 Tax=Ascaris lumbricoides TaxID=6252 RepID=A0A0M3ICB3_ASCLU